MYSARPYRLYHAQRKVNLRWRCYGSLESARWGAFHALKHECRVGETIEVVNIETRNSHCWQYTRKVNGIKIKDPSWNKQPKQTNGAE